MAEQENNNQEAVEGIKDSELNPEQNPMRVSGSKYVSDTTKKILIVGGCCGIGLLLFATVGADFFASSDEQKQEEPKKMEVSQNIFAESITKNAPADSIIPENIDVIPEKPALPTASQPQIITNEKGEQVAVMTTQNGQQYQIPMQNGQITQIPLLQQKEFDMDMPDLKVEKQKNIYQKFMEQERVQILQSKTQTFKTSVNSTTRVTFTQPKAQIPSNASNVASNFNAPIDRANFADTPQGQLEYLQAQKERALQNLERIQDPNSDINQKLAALQNGQGINMNNGGNVPFTMKAAPKNEQSNSDWELATQVNNPKTLSVMTGSVIPATMVSGINSDLAGKIIAQVSQNIYDTPTGRHLLIPQGTKLFGTYGSEVIYGQDRVFVVWNRLIFPDGKNVDIGDMNGTDQSGYAGFNDKVNNHYLRLFGGAIMMSAITAGVTYTQDKYSNNSNNDKVTASSSMSQALGNQLGNTAVQLIQRNMNISPTIEIRPGYKLNVVVTKDIIFSKPYENYDY